MKIEEYNFGERLRELRKSKGLTQEELAELSGVSRRMIGHYETVVKRPSIDKAQKIAQGLGVSVQVLMGESGIPEDDEPGDISPKIMTIARIIERLPKKDQEAVCRLVISLAEKDGG